MWLAMRVELTANNSSKPTPLSGLTQTLEITDKVWEVSQNYISRIIQLMKPRITWISGNGDRFIYVAVIQI